jgi:hypothetical protein
MKKTNLLNLGITSVLVLLGSVWIGCSNNPSEVLKTDTADQATADLSPHGETVVFADLAATDLTTDTLAPLDLSGDAADLFGPACAPGEGCFLDKCTDNSDCLSGWCVEHLGEGVCTQICQQECPLGWSCQQVAGTFPDVVYICVSNFANLCKPCNTSADCKSPGGADDSCIDYGPEGGFCGGLCDQDEQLRGASCPWGFTCKDTTTVDGVDATQCISDTATCPCTKTSAALSLWTGCEASSQWGTCPGKRVCTEDGLTDCDALLPEPEICNGLDDNCDGDIDEESCDDSNECTEDECGGEAGCLHTPLSGFECKDGNPCSVADHCDEGEGIGTPVICEDENLCTDDACDETGGCLFTANDSGCDDGDPCTVADQCKNEICGGVTIDCECQGDSDCAALEDGDLCNGTLFCNADKLPYTCSLVQGSVVECPAPEAGTDAICQQTSCDPATGECSIVPDHEGFACSDSDACTIGDACQEGSCMAGETAACADNNPCTDDGCDPEQGCVFINNEAPCNDGNVCTTDDTCNAGDCTGGPPLNCDDQDLCNGAESCSPEIGCQPGIPLECDDEDPCNGIETCNGLVGCQEGAQLICDDDNPCTDDSCLPAQGCQHAANQAPCDDGNKCTSGDLCADGICQPTALTDCDDGNPCTTDSCDLALGCTHLLNDIPCDDGDICTTSDHCQLGECTGGGSLSCDDNNGCTEDSCNELTGCQFLGLQDGTPCNTPPGSTCLNGVCLPCLPKCAGKECGDDGCDGDCGPCSEQAHEVCEADNCVCDEDSGYHLSANGNTCTNDPCDPDPCNPGNHEICSNGDCICNADQGYHLSSDDTTCTTDPCDPDPCNTDNNEVCEEGECNQYTQVSGILPPNAAWTQEGSPYLISGPLLVPEDGTFTIGPGTSIYFAPGTYIKVEGALIAVGDCDGNPIVFTTKVNPPEIGGWGGIQFRPGTGTVFGEGYEYVSGSKLACVRIEYATTGLYVFDTGLLVENSTFFKNQTAIEIRGTYKFKLADSLLEENQTALYTAYSGGADGVYPITETLLQGNNFKSNSTGISFTMNQRHFAGMEILDNEFHNQSGSSIVLGGGGYGPYLHSARIAGNWVTDCGGSGIRAGRFYSAGTNGPIKGSAANPMPEYPLSVENNLVERCPGSPLNLDTGNVKTQTRGNVLVDNEGSGSSLVVGQKSYNGLITGNVIVSAEDGITLSSQISGHTLQHNLVTGTAGDFIALHNHNASNMTVVGNNFIPTTGQLVKNYGATDITMTGNWWGTADLGTLATLIWDYYDNFELGKAIIDPVLTGPSTDAPISPPTNVVKSSVEGGIQITWDANPEADVAGYRVYYGTRTAFTWEASSEAGNALTFTLPGASLDDVIAVSAYDSNADGQNDVVEGYVSWFTRALSNE